MEMRLCEQLLWVHTVQTAKKSCSCVFIYFLNCVRVFFVIPTFLDSPKLVGVPKCIYFKPGLLFSACVCIGFCLNWCFGSISFGGMRYRSTQALLCEAHRSRSESLVRDLFPKKKKTSCIQRFHEDKGDVITVLLDRLRKKVLPKNI